MIYSVCSILFFVLALHSATATNFFQGRSGDYVVADHKASATSFVYDPSSYFSTIPSSIQDTHFADVIGRIMGVGQIDQSYENVNVPNDFFNRAQSNLLISIEGMDKNLLKELGSFSISSTPSMDISTSTTTDLSLLATMMSGKAPSDHGIIARSWKSASGALKKAFSDDNSLSHSLFVQDLLSASFKSSLHHPLILSFSSEKTLAAATCSYRLANPLAQCVSISADDETISYSFVNNAQFKPTWFKSSQTIDELLTQVKNPSTGVIGSYFDDAESSRILSLFDLSDASTLNFFAELQLLNDLSQMKHVSQSMISAHIASFKGLLTVYGKDSEAMVAFTSILDNVLPQIIANFQSNYDNKILSQIVLLSDEVQEVQDKIDQILSNVGASCMNGQVYALDEKKHQQVKAQLSNAGINLLSNAELSSSSPLSSSSLSRASVSDPIPTENDIALYQICLWLSITLAIVLIAVAYGLGWMHIKHDTLLMGSYNPNWESRKRK